MSIDYIISVHNKLCRQLQVINQWIKRLSCSEVKHFHNYIATDQLHHPVSHTCRVFFNQKLEKIKVKWTQWGKPVERVAAPAAPKNCLFIYSYTHSFIHSLTHSVAWSCYSLEQAVRTIFIFISVSIFYFHVDFYFDLYFATFSLSSSLSFSLSFSALLFLFPWFPFLTCCFHFYFYYCWRCNWQWKRHCIENVVRGTF